MNAPLRIARCTKQIITFKMFADSCYKCYNILGLHQTFCRHALHYMHVTVKMHGEFSLQYQ